MFWGISPALDLQEEYYKYGNRDVIEINILLIGSCDSRHVLKTLAQAYRHKKVTLNITIIEGCLELIARQLLLISIALESPKNLGLLERTRLFLELYGNTLIRPTTSKYMMFKAKHLIKMITNLDYMSEIIPNIKINEIKYRERDFIEMLLQFWSMGCTNKFDVCEYWDKKMRRYLGARYDSKHGVFDWDYSMRLKDIGGNVISSQEYHHFRSTGVAFTWLESEVSRPNYTLAAGVIKSGDHFYHREYVGDIVTGPFISYGLDCEDKDMMQNTNGLYKKRATDISERNVMRMLYEIENQRAFDNTIINDNGYDLGQVTIVEPSAVMSSEKDIVNTLSNLNISCLPYIKLDFANISFHSPTSLEKYYQNSEYNKKFDLTFISHNNFEQVKPSIVNLSKNDGILVFETKKFILDLRKEDLKTFCGKIQSFANDNGLVQVKESDHLKDSFVVFKMKSA